MPISVPSTSGVPSAALRTRNMPSTSTPAPGARKRKSMMFVNDTPNSSRQNSVSRVFDEEDEESQRSKRRSIASLAESIKINEQLKKEEIIPHIEICLKLYTNNKIDARNIWSLKIIDYMSAMVRHNTFESDTLKVATTTLDVSSKVYGIRVDCVHNQTVQLASHFVRNVQENGRGDGDVTVNGDAELPADGVEQPQRAKRKPKTRRLITDGEEEPFLLKDYRNSFVPIKQLPQNDFQFAQTNSTSSVANYLTLNVPMNADAQFMFMTDEPFFVDELTPVWEDAAGELIQMPTLRTPLDRLKIGEGFRDFQINKWDEHDETGNNHLTAERPTFDAEGQPIVELDGSVHDPFEERSDDGIGDGAGDDIVEVCEFAAPLLGRPQVQYVNDVIVGDDDPYENLYTSLASATASTSHQMINIWAGPSHWKLKCIMKRKSVFTGSLATNEVEKKKRARRARSPEPFDFDIEDLIPERGVQRKGWKFKHVEHRKPIQHFDAPLRPEEYLRKRFIAPRDLVAGPKPPTTAGDGGEVLDLPADYDYNNPNDSQYCMESAEDEPAGDDDAPANDDFLQPLGELDECDLPDLVPKSTIDYARRAKKMNMRKLKCAVWDSLSGARTYETGEIDKDDHHVEDVKTFNNLYSQLPTRISKPMGEALSAPLAFVALLHLANEKNLQLAGSKMLDNIHISQN